jgi:hypothetical protein
VSDCSPSTPDSVLIPLCLTGHNDAWTVLFRRYHLLLVARLRRRLGSTDKQYQIAEEIAANIRAELADEQCRRLRFYESERGDFMAFLVGFIRTHLRRCFSLKRPPAVATLSSFAVEVARGDDPFWRSCLLREELEALMNTAERLHLLWLYAGEDRGERPYNPVYSRKLTQSIHAKVQHWLEETEPVPA